ncbi:riboflavin biosynthesis protein RibF [Porphyromonas macacae]|uniref:riboflavin biosynthesis protein RibF n=1 Tax=Porphyromonas macacae TaxID=28115 RepID=UPI00068D170B|nr:riboflavin biosynthesis protein RibF [Porphyromonas macacae]
MDQIAATIGTFDGVHLGHRSLINKLLQESVVRSLPPAVITFDVPPISVVAPKRPYLLLTTLAEKQRLLDDMGIRVITLHFDKEMASMDAERFMEEVLSDVYGVKYLLIGYDHRFGHNRTQDFDDYKRIGHALGIELGRGPQLNVQAEPISSSRIRKLLNSAQIQEANSLLGYHYTLSGKVVGGMRVGRTLGFPTANIHVDSRHKLLPPHGVYGVRIKYDNACHDGMLYIGSRPSLDNGSHVTIEVNIFNINANLYDKELTLEFVFFERPDHKFDTLDELRAQISADQASIMSKLHHYKLHFPAR